MSDAVHGLDSTNRDASAVRQDRHPLGDLGEVVDTLTIHCGPIAELAVTADGGCVLATNYADDSVSLIDAATGAVAHTVHGTREPFALVTAGPGSRCHRGRAYVGAAGISVDAVLVIDTVAAEVAAVHAVPGAIAGLAVDPSSDRVYVAHTGPDGVELLTVDAAVGVTHSVEIATGAGVTAVAVRAGADGRHIYLAAHRPDGDTITVLDRRLEVLGTIRVGDTIRDIALTPAGDTLLIASATAAGEAVVRAIDTRNHTVAGTCSIEATVTALAVSRDGDRAYLLSDDGIVVLAARAPQILGVLELAEAPSCAVESPDGGHLYIADYTGEVTVATLSVPASPAAVPDQVALDDAVSRMLELQPAV